MVNQSPHIVAKVAWDTRCSDKALAVSLQNEISNWTKNRMASEIDQVLDELCPADQVWKIESLELDLGTIEYANLTSTLNDRFSHTLTDQLKNLLFYTIRDKAKIQVTKIADSNLLLLKSYLEKGYLPWWQKQETGSIKSLFNDLFKNHRQSLMQTIREVGKSHQVRTRLAQQFDETTLQKITTELEPHHQKDIITFLNDLMEAQSRDAIVHQTVSDFRKAVWYWTLTYLLVEQGRLFNKIDFVKSLLTQMATQFQLDYHELILQISTLPEKGNSKKQAYSDLVSTVGQLVGGSSGSQKRIKESESRQLLNKFNDPLSDKLSSLTDVPDEKTFASILSSFDIRDAQSLISDLKLFRKAAEENNWLNIQKIIWKLGLDYVMQNGQHKGQKSLIEFLVNSVVGKENTAIEEVFEGIQKSTFWSQPKTAHNLRAFEELQTAQQNQNGTFDSKVFGQRVRILLDRIRKANYWLEIAFEEYQQLSRWMISHTRLTSEALKEYFDKDELPERFLENLSSNAFESLLDHIAENHRKIISQFEERWKKTSEENLKFHSSTDFAIRANSIRILLNDRNKSDEDFKRALKKELTSTISIDEAEDFIIKTHGLISKRSSDQVLVSTFLMSNYDHQDFASARHADSEDIALILNYFIADGVQLKKKWIQQALKILKTTVKDLGVNSISANLTELFWKCLLSYKDHRGNVGSLKRSFDQSIAFFYNSEPIINEARQTLIELNSGSSLTIGQLKAVVAKALDQSNESVRYGRKNYSLTECIKKLIAIDAQELADILTGIPFSKERAKVLKNGIEFGDFALRVQVHSKYRTSFEALRSLYLLVQSQGADLPDKSFLLPLWQQAWKTLQNSVIDIPAFSKLVRAAILEIQHPEERDLVVILRSIQKNTIPVNAVFKEALIQVSEVFELLPDPVAKATQMESLTRCEEQDQIVPLFNDIFTNKNVPAWFNTSGIHGLRETINELLNHHPIAFLQKAKERQTSAGDIAWLTKHLDVSLLVKSIGLTHPAAVNKLKTIHEMHNVFESFPSGTLPVNLIRQAITHKILVAWTNDHWDLLSSENIWNELIWEVCSKQGFNKANFQSGIHDHLERFPSGLQLTFRQIMQEKEQNKHNHSSQSQPLEPAKSASIPEETSIIKDQIMIQNAGIVILANYISMLFERLGLLADNIFKDQASSQKAVHYLQYVATGQSHTEESLLVLNKVICGLRPGTPIIEGIDISDEDKELINGLINAVIGYWPAIGETSIDGFRGNWLVREGLLTEDPDRWDLSVDKRAYDLLIQRSPFSFSIIKYPWMEKPLHVMWPY